MSLLDTPLAHKLAPALESAINLAIAMDPGAQTRLTSLQGCVLEINITSLHHSFFFGAEEGQVKLMPAETIPTVTLAGTSTALVKLALYKDKNSLFKSKEVSLGGEAVRAQQIQSFMRNLKIDWEALLAEVIGDVPAHVLNTSLRNSVSWGKSLSSSLLRDTEEFIKYELRLLPNKARAQQQFDAIDQLRMASERLEARIKAVLTRTANRS